MIHWHAAHAQTLGTLERAADRVNGWTGSPQGFLLAVCVVLVWGALGPRFDYSDTWQLVVNTGTTIVTFLMVFLVNNALNRQAERDRHHADADYRVNLETEHRIEALQLAIARIENEKLDAIMAAIIESTTKTRASRATARRGPI